MYSKTECHCKCNYYSEAQIDEINMRPSQRFDTYAITLEYEIMCSIF